LKSNDSNASDHNWSLDDFVVSQEEGKTRFHDLDLPDQVMQGVAALGYEYCSPIQALTLPESLSAMTLLVKPKLVQANGCVFIEYYH